MSEKKYIDVDALVKNIASISDLRTISTKTIGEAIHNTPAADVEEVVHCRDCKWWKKYKSGLQGRCALHSISPAGSWYCANGVKENGQGGTA